MKTYENPSAKYPILDSMDEDTRLKTEKSLTFIRYFTEGDEAGYARMTEGRNSLSLEKFQALSRWLGVFRLNASLKQVLELYVILWNYAKSRTARALMGLIPEADRNILTTSETAYIILKSGLLEEKLPLDLAIYDNLRQILAHGFDSCQLVAGELPPSLTEDLYKSCDMTDQKIVITRGLIELATNGCLDTSEKTPVLTEECAENFVLLYYYLNKPYLGLNFYEIHAKRLQHKGFNHRLSVAAARIGLMLGLTEEAAIDVARYLARTSPAYESLVAELSGMGEIKSSEVSRIPIFPTNSSRFMRSSYNWHVHHSDANPLNRCLETAIPVLQQRFIETRLWVDRKNQESQDERTPSHDPKYYLLDLRPEAILAENGPLYVNLE